MRSTISLFFALLTTLSLWGTAFGQSKAAEEMDVQARAYYRAGAFEQGAEAFQKAYELEHKPSRLFNAGRAYEEAGNKRKASELFARFLGLESSGDKVTEARARKAKLDTMIADEDEQAATAAAQKAREQEARVHADQAQRHLRSQSYVAAAAAFESAFEANGDAEFVYEKAEALRLGKQRAEAIAAYMRYQREAPGGRSLDLARTRQRELEREANTPREPKPAGPETTSEPAALAPETGAKQGDAGSSTMRTSGIVSIGVGVVLLGTAGVFALDARSKENELQGLSPAAMDFWDQSLYDDGKGSAGTAIGLSVIGGVALVGGAALFFLGSASDEAPKSNLSVAPAVGDDGAGLALRGRF